MRINVADALRVLREQRSHEVVVATMGSSREWSKLSDDPRDFIYVPSSMGQAPTLGLGLALARPDIRIVVLNGDGCMLMNLGCLVTIAAEAPANYSLVVFNNAVYEVTGGQPTAGAGRVDFVALARAAGFTQLFQCSDIESWTAALPQVLGRPGPVFTMLEVEPVTGDDVTPKARCPMPEQIARFVEGLRAERGALGAVQE